MPNVRPTTSNASSAQRIIRGYMSATPHGQNARRHAHRRLLWPLLALFATVLLACSSPTRRETPSLPAAGETPKRGGYYKDDGPGDNPPPNLEAIPDATPRLESLHRFANRPYAVFGRDYVPATTLRPYKERGIASWYGRKFHNSKTATGETYDMYGMTAGASNTAAALLRACDQRRDRAKRHRARE